jgi:hypothetical protein
MLFEIPKTGFTRINTLKEGIVGMLLISNQFFLSNQSCWDCVHVSSVQAFQVIVAMKKGDIPIVPHNFK